ncbi:MAG: GNAT family N-acetyltransferase [Acetatifactor sp.]|nr:GNAT family N-acetyltransferase [Acetatifactor sp.]
MATNVYEKLPVMENDRFLLRALEGEQDAEDLLKVYSDEKAVQLFNSDNCTNDFHYETLEQMKEAITFWQFSYDHGYFVRWVAEDKGSGEAVGTIELFNRQAQDHFNNCGLLRLDLRSDHETEECILSILELLIPNVKEMFGCDMIATKAIAAADKRIRALERLGFRLSEECLLGKDGTRYGSYYEL